MADALTANYSWTKPTVGSDVDSWGGLVNTNFDGIDTTVKAVSDSDALKFPTSGATALGGSLKEVYAADTVATGAVTLDLGAANYHGFTVPGSAVAVSKSNAPASGKAFGLFLKLVNGGSGAITWTGLGTFHGTLPTFTLSGTDLLMLLTIDGGSSWYVLGSKLNVG